MADSVPIRGIEFEIKGSAEKAATSLRAFADALDRINTATSNGIDQKLKRIAESMSAIKNVGKVTISKSFIDSLEKLGDAVNKLDAGKLQALATAVSSLKDFNNVQIHPSWGTVLEKMADALDRIDVEKLRAFAEAMAAMRDAGSSEPVNVPLPSNGGSGGSSGRSGSSRGVPSFSNVLTSISRQSAVGAASVAALRTLGNDIAYVARKAKDLSIAFGRNLIGSLNSAASAAAKFTKALVAAPFDYIVGRVKRLTDKLGQLVSSLKRILFYRVIRTVIKEFGQALKEGTENAYWFTKTIGTTTQYIAEAYDTFASASAMMKNQVGAAWATLFANIEPFITQIIELVSRAAEVVTMFFAKLGGKDTYLKALNYGKEWAETTEDGNQAAKEWKNQLMGFDEINRLEAPDSGNNGKNNDKNPDYGAMFVEMPVESAIGDLAERMKELWDAQDWKGLGELIGNTLNDLWPDRSEWESWGRDLGDMINGAVQSAYYALKAIDFKRFGSDIAAFINSAIERIDFEIWGRLLVRKFTAALDFFIGLIVGLDWHQIGEKIGDFFRGALDEGTEWLKSYNWNEMGRTMWENIKKLIDGFDVPAFAKSLSDFIQTAADSAANFLNGIDWADVVNTMFGTLEDFIRNFDIGGVRESIGNLLEAIKNAFVNSMTAFGDWLRSKNWREIGENFNVSLQNILSGMLEMVNAVPWYDIGKAIGDFLAGIDWIDTLSKLASGLWEAFSGIISGLFDTRTGKVVLGLLGGFEALRMIFSGAKALLLFEAAKIFVTGLAGAGGFGAIVPAIGGVVTGIGSALAPLATAIFSPTGAVVVAAIAAAALIISNWDSVKEAAGKIWGEIKTIILKVWDEMKSVAGSVWKEIKDDVVGVWNELKRVTADVWNETQRTVVAVWNTIKESASTVWGSIQKTVSSVWDGVVETTTSVWSGYKNSISGIWNELNSVAKSVWGEIKNTVSGVWNEIKGTTSGVWNEIKNTTSSAWTAIKTSVANQWSSMSSDTSNAANTMSYNVSGAFNTMQKTAASADWNSVSNAAVTAMQNMANQINHIFQQLIITVMNAVNQIRAAMSSISNSSISLSASMNSSPVSWHAAGGVVKKATLVGVGESGAEAIVPLERNTEWIGKVAAQMSSQVKRASYHDESNEDVIEALFTVCDRIIRAIPDGGDGVDMEMLARSISKIQRRQARAIG